MHPKHFDAIGSAGYTNDGWMLIQYLSLGFLAARFFFSLTFSFGLFGLTFGFSFSLTARLFLRFTLGFGLSLAPSFFCYTLFFA